MEEQKIRQLFKNRSNCYVDTGDTGDVILAMDEDGFVETVKEVLRLHDVSRLLLLFDQMIKEENEALAKAGFYNQYNRETHANNKYCLAIVKSLIERRFGNSG